MNDINHIAPEIVTRTFRRTTIKKQDYTGREYLPEDPNPVDKTFIESAIPSYFKNLHEAMRMFSEMHNGTLKVTPQINGFLLRADGGLINPQRINEEPYRYIEINVGEYDPYKLLNILNHENNHLNSPTSIEERTLIRDNFDRTLITNKTGFAIKSKWELVTTDQEIEDINAYLDNKKMLKDLSPKGKFYIERLQVGEWNRHIYKVNKNIIVFSTPIQEKVAKESTGLNEFFTEGLNIMQTYLYLDSLKKKPEEELINTVRGYSDLMNDFESTIISPLFQTNKELFKSFFEAFKYTYLKADLRILRNFLNEISESKDLTTSINTHDLRKIAKETMFGNIFLLDKNSLDKIEKILI
jgi:hypothetical protein